MSAIASWILSILAIVITGTVLDVFLSGKRLGKMVQSVIGSLLVLVIITPIPIIFSGKMNCDEIFSGGAVELGDEFLDYANSLKVESLQAGVESAYAEAGYGNVKVTIVARIGVSIDISAVKINIANVVIDTPALNTNKVEKIINLCVEFLGVSKDIVTVVE